MARVVTVLLLLLGLTTIHAKVTVSEISATTLYSPQVADYYGSLMNNLRFLFYSDHYPPGDGNSESLFGSNVNTTTDLACNLSWWQWELGKWTITPLAHLSFSHKRMKYQQGYSGFLNVTYYYTYQRMTNLYAGISPEFSRPLRPIIRGGNTPFISLRPVARVVQHFSYGQLDSISFTTGQLGLESQIGFVGSPRDNTHSRGLALSLILLYERAVEGDRHIKTTYASVINKESHFPKHSWSIGMALSYSMRRFNGSKAQ